MNRLYFFTVNLLVLFVACISYAGDSNLENPYVMSYPFKSVVIHYDITEINFHGKVYEGTEVAYIKGDKLARVIKMAVPDLKGTTKNIETLVISDPDYMYVIDLTEKTGIKIDNPRKYTKPAYDKLSDEEKKAFHERMDKRRIVSLDLLGLGKKVGEEIILGKKCNVYETGEKINPEELSVDEMDKVYKKNWIWKGANIRLKSLVEGVGWSNELVATKIEENLKIPESQFIAPSDIKVTYDEVKSEFAKKQALARLHLLETGESMPIKVKLKKKITKPGEASKESESSQKSQENQR